MDDSIDLFSTRLLSKNKDIDAWSLFFSLKKRLDEKQNSLSITFYGSHAQIILKYEIDPSFITMDVEVENFRDEKEINLLHTIALSKLSIFYLLTIVPKLATASLDIVFKKRDKNFCTFHWDEAENYILEIYTSYIDDVVEQKKFDYDTIVNNSEKVIEYTTRHPSYYTYQVNSITMNQSFQQLVKQLDFFTPILKNERVEGVYGSINHFKFRYYFTYVSVQLITIEFYSTDAMVPSSSFTREKILEMLPSCNDVAVVVYLGILYFTLLGLKHALHSIFTVRLTQKRADFPLLAKDFFTLHINNEQGKFLTLDPSIALCSMIQQKIDLLDTLLSLYSIEYPEQVFESQ